MSRAQLSWTIAAAGPPSLGELLDRDAASGRAALADGRVFVDGKRVTDAELPLQAGACVELYAARAPAAALRVIARIDGLVAIDKPAGVATEPDHAGVAASVVAQASKLLGVTQGSLHALSRLDVGVSGVVLLALDAATRRLVRTLREQGKLRRRYIAIAAGCPSPASGTWQSAIGRGRGAERVVGGRDAKNAETRYTATVRANDNSLLVLDPMTGRTHQLRVHAAHAGAPLYGDGTYGGPRRITQSDGAVTALGRVALHAAWVELPFGGVLRLESPVPLELVDWWRELGGAEGDFESALAAP